MALNGSLTKNGEKEAGWVSRLFNQDLVGQEHQELKFAIHRKLLDRINLEALATLGGERVRTEVRGAVARLLEEEKTPLSLLEKERVVEEVLDEVFGLGPLEPLLQDPTISDILVTLICCGSLRRSHRESAGAWTNPLRWWTRACRTGRA